MADNDQPTNQRGAQTFQGLGSLRGSRNISFAVCVKGRRSGDDYRNGNDIREGHANKCVHADARELLAGSRWRELERLLGRKTMEVEILREALNAARVKKPLLQLQSLKDRKDGSQ